MKHPNKRPALRDSARGRAARTGQLASESVPAPDQHPQDTNHRLEGERSEVDWAQRSRDLQHDTLTDRPGALHTLARSLGVSFPSLVALGVSVDSRGVSSWPMRDADGVICGLRTRHPDGRKRAAIGSRNGFFGIALSDTEGFLVVVEGASDTAAALTLDFDAVGRASARPGRGADAGALARCAGRDVVVVPDRDNVGVAGARDFAAKALRHAKSVRWVVPPPEFKDLRAWLAAGLTRDAFLNVIRSTPPIPAQIEVAE